ncbi:hypothetical protein NQ318_005402 [Aromia moschata]|uniref:Uncharacterized protein n=1 Tax=Aromia moschata TaxID=1265417 RepID=A0AAV8YW99_9CUCU|nr:hypothetical protein NQ318_005402 [Aromia moschata]
MHSEKHPVNHLEIETLQKALVQSVDNTDNSVIVEVVHFNNHLSCHPDPHSKKWICGLRGIQKLGIQWVK